jgi:Amt family ammonium transporter
MLLTFGFFAFNGGSQLSLHKQGDAGAMSTAVSNTAISGAAGALTAIFWHKLFGFFRICNKGSDGKGKWSLTTAINGSLAGMVRDRVKYRLQLSRIG